MIRILCAAVVLVLAGCATQPQIVVRTERVEVPVSVPCRTAEIMRPVWALDVLPADAGDYEWARAAVVELGQREVYERRLEAAVAACQ
ncbi:hypothetical protein ACFOEY_20090 [Paracandidimonas soli]|uniref:Lipoprotein n=1 Tax=Paracandidimonas soli TaxID=1917182 RepID=A0A4R3UVE0_9BURK|nr:hypothetical protein EV686_107174 [Paracandidimonas soli]